MNDSPLHIAWITAGGAGMFCGSCMQDNMLARELMQQGHQVSLIPTYTPLRVDEENVSIDQIYLGGINLYLDYRFSWWNKIPRSLVRWIDHPAIIKWASSRGLENDPHHLGGLTMAMLAGDKGPLKREIDELVRYLEELNPDVIVFTNALLVGVLSSLRLSFSGPIVSILQGDDLFLNQLHEKYRASAIQLISEKAQSFDAFLTHTQFYAHLMAEYLSLPAEKFHTYPLSIDLSHYESKFGQDEIFRLGYFARLAPEKGFHHYPGLLSTVSSELDRLLLRVGGYLGPEHRDYFRQSVSELNRLGVSFRYEGSPGTLEEKVSFLQNLDLLCVPTQFQEPKGLYVLEALACGTPVLQPNQGAFPELIESTGGGLLYDPEDPSSFQEQFLKLYQNRELRKHLATVGSEGVRDKHSNHVAAGKFAEILKHQVSLKRQAS